MQLGWAPSRLNQSASQYLFLSTTRRAFRVGLPRKAQDASSEISRTRNIGIIAHIDAVCREWRFISGCNAYDVQGQDDYHGAHALL